MASFEDKIGWKRSRTRENKKFLFRSVPTTSVIQNFKKIAKKFRKFKNTIMASFQANIGGKSKRKRENKYCRSVPFLPDT